MSSFSKPSNPKDAIGIRKAPATTVSALVMAEVGVAMLEGAAKYGKFNFRGVGVRTSVYIDATKRHLLAYWEGQDIDKASGLSHITKAIASLTVLRDAQIMGMLTDDRPPPLPPEELEAFLSNLDRLSGEILDKYADLTPHHYTNKDIIEKPNETSHRLEQPFVDRAAGGEGQGGPALDWPNFGEARLGQ